VSDFFHTLFRDFAKPDYPENAIMITHGMTMRLFLMRWFHYPVVEFEQLCNPPNCDVVIMDLQENGKYKLVTDLKKMQPAHEWKLE
jgi:broad specificity phosphatase PhoE